MWGPVDGVGCEIEVGVPREDVQLGHDVLPVVVVVDRPTREKVERVDSLVGDLSGTPVPVR